MARDAWEHMSGGEGYGRVDLRLNEEGQPYVLEVNPCPDLSSNAGLARMGRAFGWSYDDLVMQVVDEALMRSQSHRAAAALVERGVRRVSGSTLTSPVLRQLTPADRGRIEAITRAVGVFRDDEVPVALEVFDGAVAGSPDYLALGAELDGRLVGWICWGPTPCTLGTFDLYWMAVDPAAQGAGVGTALLPRWSGGWRASPG